MEHLEIIYEDTKTIQYIRRVVESVSHRIENTERLEENIFEQLVKYYSHEKHRSWLRIKYLIDREVKKARQRFEKFTQVSFSELSRRDGEGEEMQFDREDELALITRKLEGKDDIKKIVSLATDERKALALKGLFDGVTVVQISKTLARRYGGKSESHRKLINRFKTDCYNAVNVVY